MRFQHSFRVGLPVEETWHLLKDIERIAPCVPGAALEEVAGDEYRGIVKVKLGPITAQYKGAVVMTEADDASHRMTLNAKARDVHGQGNASAAVVGQLTAADKGTLVSLDTDLQITGRVAQLGRGVMQDVSAKLVEQFAVQLEQLIQATPPAPAAVPAPEEAPAASPSTPRRIESQPAEAVDLLALGGSVLGKRLGIAAVVIVLAVLIYYLA